MKRILRVFYIAVIGMIVFTGALMIFLMLAGCGAFWLNLTTRGARSDAREWSGHV